MLATQYVAMDFPTCMLSDRPCRRVTGRYTFDAGSYAIDDNEETCLRIWSKESMGCGYIGLTTHRPVTRFHRMPDPDANHFPRWRNMFIIMVGDRRPMRSLDTLIIDRSKEAGCSLSNAPDKGGAGVRNVVGVPTCLYMCSDYSDDTCGCIPCTSWSPRNASSDGDDDAPSTPLAAPLTKRCRND